MKITVQMPIDVTTYIPVTTKASRASYARQEGDLPMSSAALDILKTMQRFNFNLPSDDWMQRTLDREHNFREYEHE